jgi:hypothetical protein
MIPPFNEHGYLPPGIHAATLDEIEARFGRDSEIRRAEMQSVRWLVEQARTAGVLRIILNGSFVTDEFEPNDVDCALLFGDDYPRNADAAKELAAGLPFLEIDLARQSRFDELAGNFFATDRQLVPKGMIEVLP